MDYLLRQKMLKPDISLETRRKMVPILRGEPTQDAISALMGIDPAHMQRSVPSAPEGPVPSDRIQQLLQADPGEILGAYNQAEDAMPNSLQELMAQLSQSVPTDDPRLQALAQLMQGQGQGPYRGLSQSPDLPSRADDRYMMNNPTDSALEDYVNRFGMDRMSQANERANPGSEMRVRGPGLPAIGAPMPRPRYPDLDPNNPIGPRVLDKPLGTMRPQDIQRRKDEGSMTTEQELDLVRKGMAPGGGDWEGDPSQSPGNNQEGEPTENDIRRLRANPDLLKDFIEHFGEDAVPNDLQ